MTTQTTPDLLEVCKMLLRHVPDDAMEYSEGTHGERVYVADLARAAIAKATDTEAKAVTQHTPGPWTAQQDLRSYRNQGVITDGPFAWGIYSPSYRIAKVEEDFGPRTIDVTAADAFLLAAAPDLLAACEAALERLLDPYLGEDDERQSDEIDMLAAAIAKATGNPVTVK